MALARSAPIWASPAALELGDRACRKSEGRSVADASSNAYTQAINSALASAKGMLGKNEVPNHAELQSYLKDGGQDLDPHKLAWCAAFVSASLQKAGLPVPTQVVKDSAFGPGAYAPNYLTYGSAVDPKNVQAGDILVANNGTHVGFAEGPTRQGPNGPEAQLLAGNERDASGQYAPGSYTNPATGAVANRAQVGMVGERWVPLSQYSPRRYQPSDSQASATPSASSSSAPATTTASTPFSLSAPGAGIPSAGQYQPLIDAAAKKYSLDPNFLSRLLYQENRFRPQGTSPAGAQGIAQFMPATAARYGVDVNDPGSSIEGAAHYLSDLSGRYGGNLGLTAAGYNWGEGNVDKWLQGKNQPPAETTGYVNTITGHSMDEWKKDPRLPLGSFTGPGRPPTGPATPAAPATPGTSLAGITPDQSKALMGDLSQLDKSMGGKGLGGAGQTAGDEEPQPAPMGPAPPIRNMSNPAAFAPALWGNTLNSMREPAQWGATPPGQNPYANAGGQPIGQQFGMQLSSMQQMQQMMAMMGNPYGDAGYG
jgi:hypothetical protein